MFSFQAFWKGSTTALLKQQCFKAELKLPVRALERSKLCHNPSSISFNKLFFICTWKITKLKLRLHRLSQIPEINLHDNVVLCKYLKSEIMRCVGSFTSCDLARSKRLRTAKDSQSILLISL